MWQFLAWRGQEYGLTRSAYVDERMDPEKATRAAARHLRDLYHEFGDWYLAMAAYNCGDVTVQRAVERTGYADFWELRSRGVLPLETTNYVPVILAMTIMEKNAAEYGIRDVQPDPALEYDTVEVAAPTSMALVSDITEVGLPELAALNPAVLKRVAPAGYALHIPKGAGDQLIPALESIPLEHRQAWRVHRVGPGDTLAEIGKRYGVAVSGIVALNNLPSAVPVEGDRLVIPAALRPEPPPARRTASTKSSTSPASRKSASTSGKSATQAAKRSAASPARKSSPKPSLTASASTPQPQALVAETGTR
jgi:membrane-bound lytic murein transglycosylase D